MHGFYSQAETRGGGGIRNLRGRCAHLRDERTDRCAPREEELAADEIDRLNAVGAFVDRRDAGVAIELRGAGFLDEAGAAMHLNSKRRDFDADIGAPGLGDRYEQLFAQFRGLALLLRWRMLREIGSDSC